ncbi:restriction endonuclease subunit S, partial [Anaerolineales bacterium HSG6]|nr:restriction endonuclease subunit S [Anaerolineales bacterium HSG6]
MSWDTIELKEAVSILSGYAFKSSLFNSEGNGLQIIRIRDVVRGYSNTFFDGSFNEKYLIRNGDYLIGMDGEFNIAPWKNGEALLNQRVCKIDKVNEDIIDKKYLAYFLGLKLKKIEDLTPYVTVKHLSVKTINAIKIPLPPLAEQKRIAAILDKADALRTKRRQAIAKLDALLQATFLDMFGDPVTNPMGWDTVPMKDIIVDGPQNGLYRHASDYGSGIPIIRIDSFYSGKVIGLEKLKRLRLDSKTQERYAVNEGDILINRVNSREYLGKTAIVPSLLEPTVFESNMMKFTVDDKKLMPQYLVSLMQHEYIKMQIMGRCKDAVNQSSINQSDVKSFELRIPPLETQRKYISIAKKIEVMRKVLLQNNSKLDTLFHALQQQAFRGQLS